MPYNDYLTPKEIEEMLRGGMSYRQQESPIKEIRDRNLPSDVYNFYKKLIAQIEFKKRNLQHPNSYIAINNLRIIDKKITTDVYIFNIGNTSEYFKDVVYELCGTPYGTSNGWTVYGLKDDEGNTTLGIGEVLTNICSIAPQINMLEKVKNKSVKIIKTNDKRKTNS